MKLKGLALLVIISSVMCFSIGCLFGNTLTLEGSSMEPTLHDNQKITYHTIDLADIDRYDIIVYYHPQDNNRKLLKRIIGLPGEKIECKDGIVYINDAPIDEPYVQGTTSTFSATVLSNYQYFVMGDNREASADSRSHGPIEGDDIIGVVRY